MPGGAAGLYLLGRVYRKLGDAQGAKAALVHALQLSPLLWSAYEELCALGGCVQAHGAHARCLALPATGAVTGDEW